MFLRRIFGKGEEEGGKAERRLSVEGLRSELLNLRDKRMRSCEEELRGIVGEIVSCRDEVLRALDALCEARPPVDVHSGLIKAAESARRLLSEKIRRAMDELKPPSEYSSSSLEGFSRRLAKSVNLTTDAMTAHGRYVGAVFERQLREVVLSLERIQMLSGRMHGSAERVLREVGRIDSLLLRLDSLLSLRLSAAQESERIREMEGRLSSLDSKISEFNRKLEELRGSEDYRAEIGVREEAGLLEGELQRFRNEVSSMFSEISRPLKKAWKLVDAGSHPMDREMARVLRLCIDDPMAVFSQDELVAAASRVIGEVGRLVEDRKVELEERDRRKKLEKVRSLASALPDLKRRFDQLTARFRGCKDREQPTVKAEVEMRRSLDELRAERERLVGEIEAAKRRAGETDARCLEDLKRIEAEVRGLLGREVALTF